MSHTVDFYAVASIQDRAEAFKQAIESAQRDYRFDAPVGTSAAAERVVTITDEPLPEADALALAERLLAKDDPRIRESEGPAGAIALRGGERPRTVTFDRTTWRAVGDCPPDWTKAVAQAAVTALFPREKVIAVRGSRCPDERHPILNTPIRPLTGEIDVITTGTEQLTGWLFFGRAHR